VPQPGFKAPFEEVKKVGMRAFFTAYYDNEFANMNPKPKAYHDLIQILDELVDADLDILFNGVDMCDVTDLRKEYQSIKCPIDLILGEKDESLPAAMHASILQLNPKANIHTIPGANHLPFWTHPNEFNPILANILG
jgi:pimeloyl-ACP methyl ester carboxylesterase